MSVSTPGVMLISDEQLTAEICDLERHVSNLAEMMEIDRTSLDQRDIAWFRAKLKELIAERNRRARKPPDLGSGVRKSAPPVGPSSAGGTRPKKQQLQESFEGLPIIVIENGVPRLWRPGDRILNKC